MDDSDSDDSLLAEPSFQVRKRNRKEINRERKAELFLQDAMAFANENRAQQNKIAKIQQDDVDEEELEAKTKKLQEEQELLDNETNSDGDNDSEHAFVDEDKLELLAETEQTLCLGVRHTLFQNQKETELLFQNEKNAIAKLNIILKQLERDAKYKPLQQLILSPMKQAAKQSKIFPLFFPKLVKTCEDHKIKHLPTDMLQWMFGLACSGGYGDPQFISLCSVSSQSLLQLWNKKLGLPDCRGAIVNFPAVVGYLNDWFGLQASQKTNNNNNTDDNNEKTISSQQLQEVPINGLNSMLQLCQVAMDVGIVPCKMDHATDATLSLILVGIDPIFHSHENHSNFLPSLQKCICSVIRLVKRVYPDENQRSQWMIDTAKVVYTALSTLGPGREATEDANDKHAWLCHSSILRLIPIVGQSGHPDQEIATFKAQMSLQALKCCLPKDYDTGHDSVSSALASVGITNTTSSTDLSQSLRWRTLASAYLAMDCIDKTGKDVSTDLPRFVALAELCSMCFQSGISLLKYALPIPLGEEDAAAWSLNLSQTEDEDEMMETEALKSMFENMDELINQHGRKIKQLAIGHPHVRKLYFHLNSMRQYYRLMKESFPTRSNPRQGSLDSWIVSKDESKELLASSNE